MERFRQIVSNAWTALVAISAIFIGVLWLALSIERMGAGTVIGFIALALVMRQRRSGEESE